MAGRRRAPPVEQVDGLGFSMDLAPAMEYDGAADMEARFYSDFAITPEPERRRRK